MNSAVLSDIRNVLRLLAKTPGCTIVAAVLLVISPMTPALAGESELRTYGDPSLRTMVDVRTRAIYEAASDPGSQRIFLITRGNPMSVKGARGTEVTGTMVEGAIGRILATVWTSDGKYSVEFYRTGETLVMVYETFTFFEESAPPGAWRNFMGLAAWERRVYFDAHRNIGYAEARGLQAPAPGAGGEQLQQQAQRLAELLHTVGSLAHRNLSTRQSNSTLPPRDFWFVSADSCLHTCTCDEPQSNLMRFDVSSRRFRCSSSCEFARARPCSPSPSDSRYCRLVSAIAN